MGEYVFKSAPGSSHRWAIEQVVGLPPGPLRVLDVGAAEGHVARGMRRERPDLEITAVEPSPTASAALANVAARTFAWLDDVPREPIFDVALLLDVLEHTPDPDAFLRDAVARLRPGGLALLSVPNVAHWSMRAMLLAGEFRYASRGILDRSHMRFFTRRSLRDLVRAVGLAVEVEDGSIAPVELAVPGAPGWLFARGLRRAAVGALPGLCAYQLLMRARRV
jgi:SAM-dependent methyltransferase